MNGCNNSTGSISGSHFVETRESENVVCNWGVCASVQMISVNIYPFSGLILGHFKGNELSSAHLPLDKCFWMFI